ncbi:hypothetical protein LRS73_02830 [Methylobacterium currus]|uniref:hypothetical protein n=1 Tax=Methylobacterium currus TaxID=2051553 RepID=UPI001E385754|nr:hypothetical protein [Methylobacterium currus]UHC16874.1 hypothetical protein LRS73_02830 [Methylobacterium currus]
MTRTMMVACLAAWAQLHAGRAEAQAVAVQQTSARNYVYVIQERNPFYSRSSTLTATTGRTSVTEIVAIGPDPAPLSIRQTGVANRATVYQLGAAPNLDIRQQGAVNAVRNQQTAMP